MTYLQAFNQAEKHLSKSKTDRSTYNFVVKFWQQTFEATPQLFDRIQLLESRSD